MILPIIVTLPSHVILRNVCDIPQPNLRVYLYQFWALSAHHWTLRPTRWKGTWNRNVRYTVYLALSQEV